jgi:hypothetical protein
LAGILTLAWLGTNHVRSAVGKQLPNAKLQPLLFATEGIETGQLKGQPTLIYLGATWAEQSAQAFEQFVEWSKPYTAGENLRVVVVLFPRGHYDPDSLKRELQGWYQKSGAQFPAYADASGLASMDFALLMPYGSIGFPTVLLADPTGRVIAVADGQQPEQLKAIQQGLEKAVGTTGEPEL